MRAVLRRVERDDERSRRRRQDVDGLVPRHHRFGVRRKRSPERVGVDADADQRSMKLDTDAVP